jgi:Phage integrase family
MELHHVPLGLTPKTLRNHRANAKAALLWLAKEKAVPCNGAPLTPRWERFKAQILDRGVRSRLSSLMRYCSVLGVDPEAVDEPVVDGFMAYRAQVTTRPANQATRRSLARLWNSNIRRIDAWPSRRLIEPPVKTAEGPIWDDFPEGLRQDIEQYLSMLARVHRSRNGQRLRPCKPSTIRVRRAGLVAAVRMAVKLGYPIQQFTSLGALLDPDVVYKVIDAYWQRNGQIPKAFTIDLACHLLSIARQTRCVDEPACEKLNELRETLEEHRRSGLTDKNLKLIRQVLSDGVWTRVVNLPQVLMAKARSQRGHAPVRAAVAAQLAVTIAILTVAPVRLGNLTSIRLELNLIKPGGPETNFWLVFPEYDVKNRLKLEYPLDRVVTELIEEYVNDFRPALLRSHNENWIFPGVNGGSKTAMSFSAQIVKSVFNTTGLRLTVHQFRHAAGALILKSYPGNYEMVRRVLGHRSIRTTIGFYCGLETTKANEIFGKLVREHMGFRPEA